MGSTEEEREREDGERERIGNRRGGRETSER